MKKLDLTKYEDVYEFAVNYEDYKNHVSLPAYLFEKIEIVMKNYNDILLTRMEAANQIIDIICDFMNDLK